MKAKPYCLKVTWGEENCKAVAEGKEPDSSDPSFYWFSTPEERDAYRQGVEDAVGWMEALVEDEPVTGEGRDR